MKLRLHYSIILLFAFFTSFAQVQTINTVGMTFDPDTVIINLGDTIEFGPLGSLHNAVEVDESTWTINDTSYNGGFYFSLGSPGGYFIPDSANTYYYICQPHASMGMKGVIIVNPVAIPNPEDLFFSEAAEGSGNNKYFEVYNPTGDTIDLTHYAFARVTNAPGNGVGVYEAWVDFDSAAFIAPNDVYVVCHTGSGWSPVDPIILAEADMDYGSMSNGDDGFALVYGIEPATPMTPNNGGYYVLDWIGDWNGDPGAGWDVAGVSNATQNHTLVRKCSVLKGDTSWANSAGTDPMNSQWIVLPQDDWSNLGFHNICPCDSTTNSYTSIIDTICSGQSITVGSSIYDSTGIYSDTLLAFNGCDSIISTHLTVLNTSASSTIIDLTICDGDSAILGNTFYHVSGTFVETLTNIAGCDSNVTLNLTVQTPVSWDITICDGDSIVVGSSVYNVTGSYTDTIQSSMGCDSIVHTNLIIYSQFNSVFGGILNNTVGGGNFYSGQQHLELSCYMPSELVSAVIYSDDTTLTTFEIRDNTGAVLDDTTVNVIPGGHRIYFNYNMSPGLDYELGVNGGSNNLFRHNSGVNYPYNFGPLAAVTSSSAGGNYYYFFYDIEVRQSTQPINYSICDGDSIIIGTSTLTLSGLYTDSLISSLGCDSLVFTNLVVYPNVTYTNSQTICSGETYVINGNVYDSTGTYIDSLNTSFGCDSIVTTHLFIDTITGGSSSNSYTICLGDNITVGGNTYSNTGVYVDTLISFNGCDSVVTTYLDVITANYTTFMTGLPDTSAAAGNFSNYNGHLNINAIVPSLIKSATVYAADTNVITFELRDDNGAVLDHVTHTVYPGAQTLTFNFMVPIGNDFQLGVDASGGNIGLYRSNASIPYPFDLGSISITGSNAGSQYYYYYYDIEIMPYANFEKVYLCDGDSVVVAGNIYSTPGMYIDTLSASNLCDSVLYTTLDIYQSPSLFIESNPDPPEICLGETILLEGSTGFTYYWWDNGSTGSSLIDDPTEDTWYLLSAKDSNDCVVKEDIWVYVDSCVSGLNEELFSNINIYPNPSDGFFTVEFRNAKENNPAIRIVNSIGDMIFFEKLKNGEISKYINISTFSKGIYFIELQTDDGVINKKLILR